MSPKWLFSVWLVGWFVSQKQPGKRNSKEPHYVLVLHEIIKKKKQNTKTFTRHFKTFAKSSTFPRGLAELPLHLGTVRFFSLTVKLRRKTLLKSK